MQERALYSFGEPWELLEKYGWYVKNSPHRTQPVGSLKPNDLGLFDLHGNIWEWSQGSWGELGKEGRTTQSSIYTTVTDEVGRILRGGTFNSPAANVRPSKSYVSAPSNRDMGGGIRPSRTYH